MLAGPTAPNGELRDIDGCRTDQRASQNEKIPKRFEAAGGTRLRWEIIGARAWTDSVMQHLDNMEEVGRGIAVELWRRFNGVRLRQSFFSSRSGQAEDSACITNNCS